jgi:Tol biopolymer transport system component
VKYKALILVLLAVLCCAQGATLRAAPVNAPVNAPLILLIGPFAGAGDLWAWTAPDKPLKQMTTWGYNEAPVISPDASHVAYASYAKFVVDDIKAHGGRNGYPPANIWVLDVATNQAVRAADQPPDATFGDNSQPEKFILRPQPAWSPDSKSIAWGEIVGNKTNPDGTFGGYIEQLVVYDLAQNSQRVIVHDLPGYQGLTDGTTVDWGTAGLVFLTPVGPGSPQDAQDTVYIYETSGKLQARILLGTQDASYDPAVWVADGSRTYIYLGTPTAELLLDPSNGQKSPLSGSLELYSPLAPDGISLYMTRSGGSSTWHVAMPGKAGVDLGTLDEMTIAPDGQQIAYVQAGKVFVYKDGVSTPIEIGQDMVVGGLAWGPTAFRVRH